MIYKYLKNITQTSADFYVYGAIVDEKSADYFTGEESKTEVDTMDFKTELDSLNGIKDFNIFINSAGGSVFASSTMVSMLKRFKSDTGAKIHSYIDGLCASASTYLCMVADDVNIYENSIMMIHKPMTLSIGNANDLQKDIDTLNMIENNMMIPMYESKAKVDESTLKQLINDETWFSGDKASDNFIGNFFDVNFLEGEKQAVACSSSLFKNYKHLPKGIENQAEEQPIEEPIEKSVEEPPKEEPKQQLDYAEYENIIQSLKKED